MITENGGYQDVRRPEPPLIEVILYTYTQQTQVTLLRKFELYDKSLSMTIDCDKNILNPGIQSRKKLYRDSRIPDCKH